MRIWRAEAAVSCHDRGEVGRRGRVRREEREERRSRVGKWRTST